MSTFELQDHTHELHEVPAAGPHATYAHIHVTNTLVNTGRLLIPTGCPLTHKVTTCLCIRGTRATRVRRCTPATCSHAIATHIHMRPPALAHAHTPATHTPATSNTAATCTHTSYPHTQQPPAAPAVPLLCSSSPPCRGLLPALGLAGSAARLPLWLPGARSAPLHFLLSALQLKAPLPGPGLISFKYEKRPRSRASDSKNRVLPGPELTHNALPCHLPEGATPALHAPPLLPGTLPVRV